MILHFVHFICHLNAYVRACFTNLLQLLKIVLDSFCLTLGWNMLLTANKICNVSNARAIKWFIFNNYPIWWSQNQIPGGQKTLLRFTSSLYLRIQMVLKCKNSLQNAFKIMQTSFKAPREIFWFNWMWMLSKEVNWRNVCLMWYIL